MCWHELLTRRFYRLYTLIGLVAITSNDRYKGSLAARFRLMSIARVSFGMLIAGFYPSASCGIVDNYFSLLYISVFRSTAFLFWNSLITDRYFPF